MIKHITAPIDMDVVKSLKAGDEVLISGEFYTARDAAHKLLYESLKKGKDIPLKLDETAIYYAGPTPKLPNMPVGSIGPTTSSRMDIYTLSLIKHGLKMMIGKGARSQAVKDALKSFKGVYIATIGGGGAYLAKCVVSSELVAFKELGPEAIYRLKVKDFPGIVINDSYGGDFYESAIKTWAGNGSF